MADIEVELLAVGLDLSWAVARLGYALGQGHSHAHTHDSRPRELQSLHHIPKSRPFS